MTVVIDSSLNDTSQRYGGYSDNLKNDNTITNYKKYNDNTNYDNHDVGYDYPRKPIYDSLQTEVKEKISEFENIKIGNEIALYLIVLKFLHHSTEI